MASCDACSAPLHDGTRFCGACGQPVIAADAPQESAIRALLERRTDWIVADLAREFRTLRWSAVLPLARAWRDRPWKLVWVKWFLFFALFPLGMALFFGDEGLSLQVAVSGLGLYFAVLWSFVFQLCLMPESAGKRLSLRVVAFTVVLSGVLLATAHLVPWIAAAYEKSESDELWTRLWGFTIGVGLVEELVKAVAVWWFVKRATTVLQPVTLSYLGALSGLAFGVVEAVEYSVYYMSRHLEQLVTGLGASNEGDLVNRIQVAYGEFLLSGTLRMLTMPLLHAVMTGITCFFLGVAFAHRHAGRALFLVGLTIATVLHGAYDALEGWQSFGVAVLLLIVYVAYVRSADHVGREAARADSHAVSGSASLRSPGVAP